MYVQPYLQPSTLDLSFTYKYQSTKTFLVLLFDKEKQLEWFQQGMGDCMSSRKQSAAEITKAPIDCDALFSDSKLYQVSFENSKKKKKQRNRTSKFANNNIAKTYKGQFLVTSFFCWVYIQNYVKQSIFLISPIPKRFNMRSDYLPLVYCCFI